VLAVAELTGQQHWAGGLGFGGMSYQVFGGCLSGWWTLRVAGDTWGGGTHCKCRIPIVDPVVVSLGIPFGAIFFRFCCLGWK